jgi:ArsR family metal-binding transcriptional regulator
MDKLIDDYEIQLAEPACSPGGARWGGLANLENDISAVFPYLNAILDNCRYDHENQILIFEEDGQKYAFRPHEIRVAQVRDPSEARQFISEVVDRVNNVWQERDKITPRFTERKLPAVLDIFKLLPGTNCKQCGYPTCMAYAAALRSNMAQPEQCPPLSETEFAENRQKLLDLIESD